jgi:hypothetical protein
MPNVVAGMADAKLGIFFAFCITAGGTALVEVGSERLNPEENNSWTSWTLSSKLD